METVYTLCKRLIALQKTDGLQGKMDVYLAADRLTLDEYKELVEILATTTTTTQAETTTN